MRHMPATVETCRWADKATIESVHAIHKCALPDDITPNLSRRYYAEIVKLMAEPDNGVLAIGNIGDAPVGFCFTAFDPHDFSEKIGRERLLLLKSLARFAFTRPALLVDLAGAVLGKSTFAEGESIDCPEIYVICVRDGHRSHGIGAKLVDHAVDQVRSCGRSAISVKTSDARALAFYQRHGFRKIGEQNRLTRKLAVLKRVIKN